MKKSPSSINNPVANMTEMSTDFCRADREHMQRAILLAKKGRFTTAPNPNVGCVIVKQGRIIGEGFHLRAGEPHAEVHALAAAGDGAEGATCYVTLEPCSHYGRTPPCADALVKAKVSQVIIAMVDPNPKVAGRGIAILTAAGIKVSVGLLESQAQALNPGFIQRMQQQRPFVRLKMAASLDGRTALANGESKWITGAAARSDVQVFRAQAHAILSTASTVLTDNASLNVRYNELGASQADYPQQEDAVAATPPLHQPLLHQPLLHQPLLHQSMVRQPIRVVLDNHHRLDKYLTAPGEANELQLFSQPGPIFLVNGIPVLINGAVSSGQKSVEKKPVGKAATVVNKSVSRIEIAQDSHHNIDLKQLMTRLAQQDINDIWVEAGATLAGALLENKLVDEIIIYLAPKLMGNSARGLAQISELTDMAQVPQLSFIDITQIGDDLRIIAKPEY
jgi:diaminohydroxyphosphoribosylaminopyrimidine deaminase/5-amino-6-(5-phosphoribosylamino)uracil reductase